MIRYNSKGAAWLHDSDYYSKLYYTNAGFYNNSYYSVGFRIVRRVTI